MQAIQYNRPSLELIFSTFKNENNNKISNKKTNTESLETVKNLFEQNLIFKNVSFKYNNSKKSILSGINFEIHPKDIFGILGESGAGKSTIIDLIIGLLNPTNGNILIDGEELKLVKSSWQKLIGYVPQNIFLNDESIRENITFNRETSQKDNEKVIEAMKKARIYEFVESLPEGMETKVGERGVKLSGGQKQRIRY